MENDLAVGGGLKNGAFALQFVAQDSGVDQVAVVRDRHLAAQAIDHERLRIFDRARPGGGITGVADRSRPFQSFQFFLPENLRNESHAACCWKGLRRAPSW